MALKQRLGHLEGADLEAWIFISHSPKNKEDKVTW